MAKYPLSIQDSIIDGKMSQAFKLLLELHLPEGAKILDPTAGGHLLWKSILFNDEMNLGLQPQYDVTFSDINSGEGNLTQNLGRALEDRPEWKEAFDCVVYDPPYFIELNDATRDTREDEYGGYAFSRADLIEYMKLTCSVIPHLLKENGRLILKCADQFVVSERKFYLHHYEWLRRMTKAFDIIDMMILPASTYFTNGVAGKE